MNIFPIIFSALILISSTAFAGQSKEAFLAGFVVGKYHLVGKRAESNETYYGKVELLKPTENRIEVHRTISGKTITGIGTIETATPDNTHVLRIRFQEKNQPFEETCLIGSDLDNYARITCYLYQPDIPTNKPGLEAFFIEQYKD